MFRQEEDRAHDFGSGIFTAAEVQLRADAFRILKGKDTNVRENWKLLENRAEQTWISLSILVECRRRPVVFCSGLIGKSGWQNMLFSTFGF